MVYCPHANEGTYGSPCDCIEDCGCREFMCRITKTAPAMRKFTSGATRDNDTEKLDFEGFDSPLVNKRYAKYMHLHRKQADGSMRGSDNWQAGIPKEAYVKSLIRHMEDLKLHWDGYPDEAVDGDLESVLCAVLFNAKGLLFEVLKDKRRAASVSETLASTARQEFQSSQ